MRLGDFITQYRLSHSLSQRQFATTCGLSNGYISMLEKGINPATQKPVTPTIPQLKKLAAGMCLSLMELLEQVDDMSIDISGREIESDSQLIVHDCNRIPDMTDEECTLVQKYRCLDDRGKSAVLNVLNFEYDSLSGEKADTIAKEA